MTKRKSERARESIKFKYSILWYYKLWLNENTENPDDIYASIIIFEYFECHNKTYTHRMLIG